MERNLQAGLGLSCAAGLGSSEVFSGKTNDICKGSESNAEVGFQVTLMI